MGLLLVLCLLPMSARAQQYAPDSVKAAFLYRFAGYVEWPEGAADSDRFVIATLCGDAVAEQLDLIVKGRAVNGLPAEVRRLRRVGQIDGAQMLYVGPGCSTELAASRAALASRPVLIVTDDEEGLHGSATINFISVDQHIRFEVSVLSAQRSGLRISSELLSVAARVLGGRMRSHTPCVPMSLLKEKSAMCAPPLVSR